MVGWFSILLIYQKEVPEGTPVLHFLKCSYVFRMDGWEFFHRDETIYDFESSLEIIGVIIEKECVIP